MRCDQFQSRMDLLLDGRESPERDPDLISHSEQCDACARKLVFWRQIHQVVDGANAGGNAVAGEPRILFPSPVGRPHRDSQSQQSANAPANNAPANNAPVKTRWQPVKWHWIAIAASLFVVGNVALSRYSQRGTDRLVLSQSFGVQDSSSPESLLNTQGAVLPSAKQESTEVFDFDTGSADRTVVPGLSWQRTQWWSMMDEAAWIRHTRPAVDSVRAGVAPLERSMRRAFAILMIQTKSIGSSDAPVESSENALPFKKQTSLLGRGPYVIV